MSRIDSNNSLAEKLIKHEFDKWVQYVIHMLRMVDSVKQTPVHLASYRKSRMIFSARIIVEYNSDVYRWECGIHRVSTSTKEKG